MSWHQHYALCEKCKESFYSVNGNCNVCGTKRTIKERDHSFSLKGRFFKGKIWDSKAHKYKKANQL